MQRAEHGDRFDRRSREIWRDVVGDDGKAKDANVEAVISTNHGSTTEHVTTHYVDEIKGYRALFDVRPADDSNDPVDLRLYLRIDGRPLTETWIYQWVPPPLKDRKALL